MDPSRRDSLGQIIEIGDRITWPAIVGSSVRVCHGNVAGWTPKGMRVYTDGGWSWITKGTITNLQRIDNVTVVHQLKRDWMVEDEGKG